MYKPELDVNIYENWDNFSSGDWVSHNCGDWSLSQGLHLSPSWTTWLFHQIPRLSYEFCEEINLCRLKSYQERGSRPDCPYDIQTQRLSLSSSSGYCKELLTQHIIPWVSVAFYSLCIVHGSCVTDRSVGPLLHAAFKVYSFPSETFSPLVTQPLLFGG